MSAGRPITEDDLQSYVDQALDPRRHAQVETWLGAHPELRARVDADIAHRDALRAALAPVAEEPVPAELSLARLIERHRKPDRSGWRAAAAAVLLLLAGGGAGWSLHSAAPRPQAGIAALAEEAADSYAVYAPDLGRPVELNASDRAQLVKWASRRLERPVRVPDLSSAGFQFIGGRLVATPHGPAVLYMFDNGAGTRLVMLTRNMAIDRDAPMQQRAHGPVAAISWSRDGLGYSLVGPLDPAQLHPIADAAKAQFNRT